MNNQSRPRYLIPHPAPPPPPESLGGETADSSGNSNSNNDECEYHQKKALDAWMSKLARTKRRIARQHKTNFKHLNFTPPNDIPIDYQLPNLLTNNVIIPNPADIQTANDTLNPDLHVLFTPDNKRLKMVLKKELKKSDVGSLGRIVLPKREAENGLPTITDKEGEQLVIKDIFSNNQWVLKYKYWINNKSRMYVLENTGDFVKQNGLGLGDSITLYEDEFNNLYVAMRKGEKVRVVNSNNKATRNDNLNSNAFARNNDDKDMTSLGLFSKEQLPQQVANNNVVASFSGDHIGGAPPPPPPPPSPSPTPPPPPPPADEHLFDDCYSDLGILPEVNRYKYYDYLALFDPMTSEKP